MKTLFLFLFCSTFSLSYAQGSGQALSFNGVSNIVECPYISLGTSDFSWEGWLNFSSTMPTAGITGTWRYSGTITIPYFYVCYGFPGPTTTLTATFFHGTGTGANVYASWNTGGLTGWHHVAATYQRNGSMRLYVDGMERASANIAPWAGVSLDASNKLILGNFGPDLANAGGFYLQATLDEVRLWKKLLTPQEIQNRMCQRLTGTEPGLTAYYRMDEGADNTCSGGQDVCDSSGNGYHGIKF